VSEMCGCDLIKHELRGNHLGGAELQKGGARV